VDPHCLEEWNREDDLRVWKMLRNQTCKKWELLKLCRDIIDENDQMIASMSEKEKLKENLVTNVKEKKDYDLWKIRNMKTLNLKESKLKENVKSGPFENFCHKKGLNRKKEKWEIRSEKETERKEDILKELKSERKCARSKKKKIQLYKKGRDQMKENIQNWKETKATEEETLFKEMKRIALQERKEMKQEIDDDEEKEEKEEENLTSLRKVSNFVKKPENWKETLAVTLFAPKATNLRCVSPKQASSATDCGQLTKIIFTKPQPVYRPGRAAEARGKPRTGPTHQWERSSGDQTGRVLPASQ
jgi:hypothetical protein